MSLFSADTKEGPGKSYSPGDAACKSPAPKEMTSWGSALLI